MVVTELSILFSSPSHVNHPAKGIFGSAEITRDPPPIVHKIRHICIRHYAQSISAALPTGRRGARGLPLFVTRAQTNYENIHSFCGACPSPLKAALSL